MPRVLLADDDPALLDLLQLAVEDAGQTAVTARDGLQALRLIRERKPAFIV
jgi:CheY-like chemotaxis protein